MIADANIGAQTTKSIYANRAKAFFAACYAKVGRIIIEKKHYWIYPSLGLGVAAIDINTYNDENDEVTNLKNKLLSSPSVDIGFNADYIVNENNRPGWLSSIAFGIKNRLSCFNKKIVDGTTMMEIN